MSKKNLCVGILQIILGFGILFAGTVTYIAGEQSEHSCGKQMQAMRKNILGETALVKQTLQNQLQTICELQMLQVNKLNALNKKQLEKDKAIRQFNFTFNKVYPKQQAAMKTIGDALRPYSASLEGIVELKKRQGKLNAPLRMIGDSFSGMYEATRKLQVGIDDTYLALIELNNNQTRKVLPVTDEYISALSNEIKENEKLCKQINDLISQVKNSQLPQPQYKTVSAVNYIKANSTSFYFYGLLCLFAFAGLGFLCNGIYICSSKN